MCVCVCVCVCLCVVISICVNEMSCTAAFLGINIFGEKSALIHTVHGKYIVKVV